ncbi:hypothetical protein PoB_005879000 [Plakobranchus ocellatus]|uniref:Uncharacterized protein n=1 Tax=Plakobranchus ocellatus TaxID=259542 RepID=A0AAV4CKA8_9GAST|nr:hypothetical protein PoB_005879000 [Plakobranchus ocellatus]
MALSANDSILSQSSHSPNITLVPGLSGDFTTVSPCVGDDCDDEDNDGGMIVSGNPTSPPAGGQRVNRDHMGAEKTCLAQIRCPSLTPVPHSLFTSLSACLFVSDAYPLCDSGKEHGHGIAHWALFNVGSCIAGRQSTALPSVDIVAFRVLHLTLPGLKYVDHRGILSYDGMNTGGNTEHVTDEPEIKQVVSLGTYLGTRWRP